MSDSEMRRLFANRLKHYLNMNGYTQADMARYMNVSTATTAKWCTGVTIPRVDKIQSICNWLRIEKSDLLDADKPDGGSAIMALAEDTLLIETIRSLDPERRKRLMEYARYLLFQQEKEQSSDK